MHLEGVPKNHISAVMTTYRLAFLIALGFTLSGMAAMAEPRSLSGTVTYRERMALPPSAVINVKLVDVSLADAPSTTIAETSVQPAGQVPVRYRLQYDTNDIKPRHSYALQARITVGNQLLFITTTRHSMTLSGADNTDIIVQRVGTRSDIPQTPAGRRLAEDIGGGGVIDRLQTVLEITADGKVSGTGGCNRMTGEAIISGAALTFTPIASTNMACTPAIMNQEQKFFAALEEVRAWRVDPTRQKLVLLGADGKPLLTFARM